MSKQFKTEHAKNAANLQKIIQQVPLNTNYNPAVQNLTTTKTHKHLQPKYYKATNTTTHNIPIKITP